MGPGLHAQADEDLSGAATSALAAAPVSAATRVAPEVACVLTAPVTTFALDCCLAPAAEVYTKGHVHKAMGQTYDAQGDFV